MKKLYIYGAEVCFWDPVRGRHTVKQRPRLVFSDDESRLLSPTILAGLARNSEEKYYYTEPTELTGTWKELRARILGPEFGCVIIATDHDDFTDAYADLLLAESGPLIADLRNALPTWLRPLSLPANEKEILQKKLEDHSKYMLLGVH